MFALNRVTTRWRFVRLNRLRLEKVIINCFDFVPTFYLYANLIFVDQVNQPGTVN